MELTTLQYVAALLGILSAIAGLAWTIHTAGYERLLRTIALMAVTVTCLVILIAVLWSWIAPSAARNPDIESELAARNPHIQSETNSIGMKLVLIPAGEFLMGSPEGEGYLVEHPQHRVRITKAFYLGTCEVTQEQYERVMGSNPSCFCKNGSGKDQVSGQDTGSFPVEMVSWEDAVEFCRRLSELPGEKSAGRVYRLPTEAEWEYACRAGSSGRYGFGDQERGLGEHGWFSDNSHGKTHPVGQKKPNAWGLYDVHGNVWEWCADWYESDYYGKSPVDDPPGPSSRSSRVLRGGGWGGTASYCRSAYRPDCTPAFRYDGFGLRVACVR